MLKSEKSDSCQEFFLFCDNDAIKKRSLSLNLFLGFSSNKICSAINRPTLEPLSIFSSWLANNAFIFTVIVTFLIPKVILEKNIFVTVWKDALLSDLYDYDNATWNKFTHVSQNQWECGFSTVLTQIYFRLSFGECFHFLQTKASKINRMKWGTICWSFLATSGTKSHSFDLHYYHGPTRIFF